jgi:hypothetical protein
MFNDPSSNILDENVKNWFSVSPCKKERQALSRYLFSRTVERYFKTRALVELT